MENTKDHFKKAKLYDSKAEALIKEAQEAFDLGHKDIAHKLILLAQKYNNMAKEELKLATTNLQGDLFKYLKS